MGRHVGQRNGQYDGDVVVVQRLAKAVEQDSGVTAAWRQKVSTKLRDVARDLLMPERVATSMGKPKKAVGE